jgi:hypothetical protein
MKNTLFKSNFPAIFWGVVLIIIGGFTLTGQMGLIDNHSPQFWMTAFAGLSLLFLVTYLVSGFRAWGWLFPTFISGALALTIFLADYGYTSSAIGAPILLSVAFPFIVAFGLDVRKNWWALIPAWVMFILAMVTFAADRIQGETITMIVMLAFALPLVIVFVLDRTRWWALIPAFVFGSVAFIPALAANFNGGTIGGFVNIVIGLPFIAAYLVSPKAWWAIIPGGVMASIGLMIILTGLPGNNAAEYAIAMMFLGWAATFALVFIRQTLHPAKWAIYPAIVMASISVIMLLIAAGFQTFYPLVLIGAGIVLLVLSLRKQPSQTN